MYNNEYVNNENIYLNSTERIFCTTYRYVLELFETS